MFPKYLNWIRHDDRCIAVSLRYLVGSRFGNINFSLSEQALVTKLAIG
jgi:hypothetical protein